MINITGKNIFTGTSPLSTENSHIFAKATKKQDPTTFDTFLKSTDGSLTPDTYKKDTINSTKNSLNDYKNSYENIENWISAKSTGQNTNNIPAPDDEALINALYSDSFSGNTGCFVVEIWSKNGQHTYFPPKNASLDEKKAYIDSVKSLSAEERFNVAGLIQEKFGFKPTCRAFQRISIGDTSYQDLWNSIISDLETALADSNFSDVNENFFNSALESFTKIRDHYKNLN